MKEQLFVRIGNRVLNLAGVRYMDVEGQGKLVNVHFAPDHTIQYIGDEAEALIAVLETGYMRHIHTESEAASPR
jgi:hypothetical protein